MKGREYTFRKWHSLMGSSRLVSFDATFNCKQLCNTRSRGFNKAAGFMELLPFRYALEIFIIFLPILYHAIYGLYIAFTAKNNAVSYGYFRNWMFVFQRISGIVTLIFIAWHVWETRIQAMLGKEVNYDMMADILNNPAMFAFYLVGVVSTIFHFANGLWTFCISWGITVSPRSQRISTYVTLAIFLGLSYVGVSALLAFIDPQLANQ